MRMIIVEGVVDGNAADGTALSGVPQQVCIPLSALTAVSLMPQYSDTTNKVIIGQAIILQAVNGGSIPVIMNGSPGDVTKRSQMLSSYSGLLADLSDDSKILVSKTFTQL
jgi:hypothetical protein